MWILVIICFIGMSLFWALTCTMVMVNKEIEIWVRALIGITSIPAMFGMIALLLVTADLDDSRKEVDMLYKKMKQQEKYELIQEPVYRKIK